MKRATTILLVAMTLVGCKAKHLPDGDPRDTEREMLRKHVTPPGDGGAADAGHDGKGR